MYCGTGYIMHISTTSKSRHSGELTSENTFIINNRTLLVFQISLYSKYTHHYIIVCSELHTHIHCTCLPMLYLLPFRWMQTMTLKHTNPASRNQAQLPLNASTNSHKPCLGRSRCSIRTRRALRSILTSTTTWTMRT